MHLRLPLNSDYPLTHIYVVTKGGQFSRTHLTQKQMHIQEDHTPHLHLTAEDVSSPFLPRQPQSQGQGHTRILWICPHCCSGETTAFLSWSESALSFCKKSLVILPPRDGKQWWTLKQGQQEHDTEAAWESYGFQLHFPALELTFPTGQFLLPVMISLLTWRTDANYSENKHYNNIKDVI